MTNSAGLFWLVLIPLFAVGCGGVEHSKQQWRMVITDLSRRLLVVTTSPNKLFRVIPSYHTRRINNTVSDHCVTGWLEPKSGRLATVEREGENNLAIRVYDRSMNLVAEHRPHTPYLDSYSCPILSHDGNQLVWIDHEQNVLIGEIQEDETIQFRTVCQIPKIRVHFNEHGILDWLGDGMVVAGGNVAESYIIHLATGECKLVDHDAELLGVVGTELGINDGWDGVSLMSTEGERIRKLGVSAAPSYHDYAGYEINRISPDGRYLAYDRPVALGFGGWVLTIQDLSTNRRVSLRWLYPPISMGSWTVLTPGTKNNE